MNFFEKIKMIIIQNQIKSLKSDLNEMDNYYEKGSDLKERINKLSISIDKMSNKSEYINEYNEIVRMYKLGLSLKGYGKGTLKQVQARSQGHIKQQEKLEKEVEEHNRQWWENMNEKERNMYLQNERKKEESRKKEYEEEQKREYNWVCKKCRFTLRQHDMPRNTGTCYSDKHAHYPHNFVKA